MDGSGARLQPHEGRGGEGHVFWPVQERIKHVIYIIKENRTYDQIFGDLKQDGKPVANGDPA